MADPLASHVEGIPADPTPGHTQLGGHTFPKDKRGLREGEVLKTNGCPGLRRAEEAEPLLSDWLAGLSRGSYLTSPNSSFPVRKCLITQVE